MMVDPWLVRVEDYLKSLAQCVENLDDALDNMRMGTVSLDALRVGSGTDQLSQCLRELETLIAERTNLLEAEDVPLRGVSLRDVLNRCIESEAKSLADECQRLSQAVDLSRERAVALFVCQFHLNEFSAHMLAILRTGADHGTTYEQGKSEVKRVGTGGSVFNKAA
jgi:hypothetical protein